MTGDAAPPTRARPGARVRQGQVDPLPPAKLERWLLDAGLAERDTHGRLQLTRRGWRIAGALDHLG